MTPSFATPSVCTHEATHAAVALHLGLAVREVRVSGEIATPRCRSCRDPRRDDRSRGCLLEEDCLARDTQSVLVAMCAPSCVQTGDRATDYYSLLEASLALAYGQRHGLDPDWILSLAHQAVLVCEEQILYIADRLEQEGVLSGLHLRAVHDQAQGSGLG
jgi:hypothetical protein